MVCPTNSTTISPTANSTRPHWDNASEDAYWSDSDKQRQYQGTDSPVSPTSLRPSLPSFHRSPGAESLAGLRLDYNNQPSHAPSTGDESDGDEDQDTAAMSKSELRKYKNRLSAKRSRMRSRGRLEQLEHEVKELTNANHRLQRTVESLLAERERGWQPAQVHALPRLGVRGSALDHRTAHYQPYGRAGSSSNSALHRAYPGPSYM